GFSRLQFLLHQGDPILCFIPKTNVAYRLIPFVDIACAYQVFVGKELVFFACGIRDPKTVKSSEVQGYSRRFFISVAKIHEDLNNTGLYITGSFHIGQFKGIKRYSNFRVLSVTTKGKAE